MITQMCRGMIMMLLTRGIFSLGVTAAILALVVLCAHSYHRKHIFQYTSRIEALRGAKRQWVLQLVVSRGRTEIWVERNDISPLTVLEQARRGRGGHKQELAF